MMLDVKHFNNMLTKLKLARTKLAGCWWKPSFDLPQMWEGYGGYGNGGEDEDCPVEWQNCNIGWLEEH